MIRYALLIVLGIVLIGTAMAAPPAGPPKITPPGLTPVEPPGKAPTLAMRPREHGGFIDKMDCSACHTPSGWELGAGAKASGFDHDKTGFPLRGAHQQTDCGGCHESAAKPATTCEGCHRDVHQGRNNGPCAECHTATAWSDTTTLDQHRRTRMPLTGRHATVDCVACHKRQSERGWSDVPHDCYGCHRAEFHGNTHPIHDGTGVGGTPIVSRECGLCHQTSAWSPATCSGAITPCPGSNTARRLDHPWFALTTGSHRTAECAACHADAKRPQFVRCDGCHQDLALRQQHRGAAMPHGAAACLRCHPGGAAR